MADPQQFFKNLQRQMTAATRGGGGGGGQSPRVIGGLLLLGGAAVVANNALFNVDGGHRAIKYTRIGGVGKEIYSEGLFSAPL
jgi:prohibitin 2